MKQTKRKVFDAIDLMSTDEPVVTGIQMLNVNDIVPFHEHPFKLYEGERLNDMVESIREHGILTPVIVRKTGNRYEMLAGHNRHNAAKLAGLTELPAIIKEELSDEEALVYVIETNVMQRSFNDLSISERIVVLSTRYNEICGTKKREEIVAELHKLNGEGGHDVHQFQKKSRELIGQEYGMTGRNIARYVRCNNLIKGFKEMLDDGSLALVVGVELSYLSVEAQGIIKEIVEKNCVSIKLDTAKKLRGADVITVESAQTILGIDKPLTAIDKPVSVKLSANTYSRYFSDIAKKDVQGILEAALDMYFDRKGA